MDVVFAINEHYAKPLGVCMISLIVNQNPSKKLKFHILHSDLLQNSQSQLTEMVRKYGHDVSFYDVGKRDVSIFPLTIQHITIEVYYRFFIPLELEALEKVLYLDVDIIIDGDLSELWDEELGDNFAGVILDPFVIDRPHLEKLGFTQKDPYFNSGVMLLNLKALRNEAIVEKSAEIIRASGKHIEYQDQDVLNIMFKGRCHWLPPSFNMLLKYYQTPKIEDIVARYNKEMARQLSAYKRNPKIIHYTGKRKPWNYRFFYPKRALYLSYLWKSLWKRRAVELEIIFFLFWPLFVVYEFGLKPAECALRPAGKKLVKKLRRVKRAFFSGDQ